MSSAETSIQRAGEGDSIHDISARKYEKGALSSEDELENDIELGTVDYKPELRKKQVHKPSTS